MVIPTGMLIFRAGVDINTIRAWLGHLSLDTTHINAEVDIGGLQGPPPKENSVYLSNMGG